MLYAKYVTATGEIVAVHSSSNPDAALLHITDTLGIVELTEVNIDASDVTHYVLAGVITSRPTSPCTINTTSITANGTSEATISNIPTAASITVNGTQVVNDGLGSLSITSDVPKSFVVLVSNFPALDYEVTINAV